MTSARLDVCNDPVLVERQLKLVCRKLNATEINIGLFNRMLKKKVATNDVRNFSDKQNMLKHSYAGTNWILPKVAMTQKLKDAYSTADRLRKEKKELKENLMKIGYSKSKTKRTVKKVMTMANNYRSRHKKKVIKKFEVCEGKMNVLRDKRDNDMIPEDIWGIVKDVDVFNRIVVPECPADPMICDSMIKLSRSEMAFLRKGPKFMLRGELNEQDFKVEIQKSIVKEKYDKSEVVNDVEGLDTSNASKTDREGIGDNATIKEIEAKMKMVYDKENKSLDLGRLKASDYKYNKFIHLPKPESINREAMHEVRKEQMLATFRSVKSEAGTREQVANGALRRISSKMNSSKFNKGR